MKKVWHQKNVCFGGNLEIVFKIIFNGRVLVKYVNFHADLISNSDIATLFGHPVYFSKRYIEKIE